MEPVTVPLNWSFISMSENGRVDSSAWSASAQIMSESPTCTVVEAEPPFFCLRFQFVRSVGSW